MPEVWQKCERGSVDRLQINAGTCLFPYPKGNTYHSPGQARLCERRLGLPSPKRTSRRPAKRGKAICKVFAVRREAHGKPPIVIIGAIMNKLLHLAYGILKTQKPFDPEYLKKQEKNA